MSHYRVFVKRVISADGRTIAAARSEVFTTDTCSSSVMQSVTVHVSSSGMSRHVSSCSSSHSSSQSDG